MLPNIRRNSELIVSTMVFAERADEPLRLADARGRREAALV